MPSWNNTQFEIKLPAGTLRVPAAPIAVPADSYFYWPLNLDLDGVQLRYATAQPLLKLRRGNSTYLFFAETHGIPAEFAFPRESKTAVHAESGSLTEENGLLRIQNVGSGLSPAIIVQAHGNTVHLVLLSPSDAKNLWSQKLRSTAMASGSSCGKSEIRPSLQRCSQPLPSPQARQRRRPRRQPRRASSSASAGTCRSAK